MAILNRAKQAAQGTTSWSKPLFSTSAKFLNGRATDNNLDAVCASVEPQQIQFCSSTSSMPSLSQTALRERSYSLPVERREQLL